MEKFLDKLSDEKFFISINKKKKSFDFEIRIGKKSFDRTKELFRKLDIWKLPQGKVRKNSFIKSKFQMKSIQKKLKQKIQKKY